MSGFAATKGVFMTRSDVALQSFNDFGFRPVAVIAWWSCQAGHGIERGNRGGIGFWTRDMSSAVAWSSSDGTPSSDTSRLADDAAILGLATVGHALSMRAEVASFDADGFTLHWSVQPMEPWIVHFLAFGGEPSIRGRVGCVSSQPAGASTSLGLPEIRADLLLLVPTPVEAGSRAQGLGIGIGAASRRRQVAAGYASPHGAPPGTVTGAQRSGSAVIVLNDPDGPPLIGAVRAGARQDLAIEWSGAGQPTERTCYLALEGLRAKVGTDVSTAAPGRRKTRVGFRPEAILLFSWGLAASAQPRGIGRLCIGGASERESGCAGWDDRNVEAHETRTHVVSSIADALIIIDTQTGGVHARAALDSIDDSGFTLDWIESDGKLRQFAYVAMGRPRDQNRVSRALRRRPRDARGH